MAETQVEAPVCCSGLEPVAAAAAYIGDSVLFHPEVVAEVDHLWLHCAEMSTGPAVHQALAVLEVECLYQASPQAHGRLNAAWVAVEAVRQQL